MAITNMVRFIHEHGVNAYALPTGEIRALMHYTYKGELFSEWETVSATWKNVRNWLGY